MWPLSSFTFVSSSFTHLSFRVPSGKKKPKLQMKCHSLLSPIHPTISPRTLTLVVETSCPRGWLQNALWLLAHFFFLTIICWFSKLEEKIQVTSTCMDLHLKYLALNCSNAGRSVSAWFLISPNDDGRPPYLMLLFPHLCSDLWKHCGT